jgi:phosphoribosylaminoimidazole-succinocarboxamide synthase
MNLDKYPIIYSGSIKNLREVEPRTESKMGKGIFEFTSDSTADNYSKLPFETPHKAEDLCAMAVQSFEELEALGIPSVFREQVSDNAIMIDLVNKYPENDPRGQTMAVNRLVPLKVIIRNVVTETSSACKRMKAGKLSHYSLGLSRIPEKYPVILPRMFFDANAMDRNIDNYLPWDVLQRITGLGSEFLNQIEIYARGIGLYALKKGASSGLIINDFKVEWALDNDGELMLADVPLSIDEITCAYVGHPFNSIDEFKDKDFKIFSPGKEHHLDAFVNLSKQIYRDHYHVAAPDYIEKLHEAKLAELPKEQYPVPELPPELLVSMVSDMFGGLRNLWAPDKARKNIPDLCDSTMEYKRWASSYYDLF